MNSLEVQDSEKLTTENCDDKDKLPEPKIKHILEEDVKNKMDDKRYPEYYNITNYVVDLYLMYKKETTKNRKGFLTSLEISELRERAINDFPKIALQDIDKNEHFKWRNTIRKFVNSLTGKDILNNFKSNKEKYLKNYSIYEYNNILFRLKINYETNIMSIKLLLLKMASDDKILKIFMDIETSIALLDEKLSSLDKEADRLAEYINEFINKLNEFINTENEKIEELKEEYKDYYDKESDKLDLPTVQIFNFNQKVRKINEFKDKLKIKLISEKNFVDKKILLFKDDIEKRKKEIDEFFSTIRLKFPPEIEKLISRTAIEQAKFADKDENNVKKLIKESILKYVNENNNNFKDFDELILTLKREENLSEFTKYYTNMVHGYNKWSLLNIHKIKNEYNPNYILNNSKDSGRKALLNDPNINDNDLIGLDTAFAVNILIILRDLVTLTKRFSEIKEKIEHYISRKEGKNEEDKKEKNTPSEKEQTNSNKKPVDKTVEEFLNTNALNEVEIAEGNLYYGGFFDLKNENKEEVEQKSKELIKEFTLHGHNNFSEFVDKQVESAAYGKKRVKKYAFIGIKTDKDTGKVKICLALSNIELEEKRSFVELNSSTTIKSVKYTFKYRLPENKIFIGESSFDIDINGKVVGLDKNLNINKDLKSHIENIKFPSVIFSDYRSKIVIDNSDEDIILKRSSRYIGLYWDKK